MESNNFCVFEQQNLDRRFGASKMLLSLLVASAVVRSKTVVLLLSSHCLFLLSFLWMFIVWSLLCST